jgi:hypothetical protein
MSATAVEQFNGQWFISVDSSDIVESELRFRDMGNGPELTAPDGVHGPFYDKAAADRWLADYERAIG